MRSIPALLDTTVEQFGDEIAVVDGAIRLTYRELDDAAADFAAALVESGVEPGDRVAIWCFNSSRWITAALGIFKAGAVLVPINTRFKGPEAADILLRSKAKVLVTITDFLGVDYVAMLRACGVALPALTTVVVAHGDAVGATTRWEEFVGTAAESSRAEVRRRSDALGPEDPSDILFTSGTTGVAKGVVQTHGRTLTVAMDWPAMNGLHAGDRYLMVNPYFHMFGLKAGILASVSVGATMYPVAVFDVEDALQRVNDEKITVFPGAPTIYQSILECPNLDKYDISSLRIAVTGAADIPVELIRRIDRELPFTVLISGYGLTEGGTATATEPGDDVETIATTIGKARPSFEIRLVDDKGEDVPTGEPGEIWLRGASIMSHYLDNPEATAETLTPEGWLKTGDIATMDAKGYLRIVGRAKDMFIVGGFNAYPAEIENSLMRHPEIAAAAVIGIPDERLGEVGAAFVVLTPGSRLTGDEIVAWAREQMANYKAPRLVAVVDALPLNATGKVVKDDLRRRVGPNREISPA
jgi:acyl-CoA synthetase (AMP-forming)/AMP-acid ligase II